MTSPFQQLLTEFEDIDRADIEHIAVVLVAMVIGVLAGVWASRRRERDPQARKPGIGAWKHALWYGLTFPLVTCVLLVVFRLTTYGAASGMLPKLAVPVFASLTVVRAVARVLRGLFPNSSPVRAVINSVSVLVWLGVVTHMAGVLPTIETELEALRLPIGKTQVSALTMLQGLGMVAVTLLGTL